jgi:elongation factor G
MLRVVSGTVRSDTTVFNLTRGSSERLGHLLVLQGKAQTQVPELKAGDLGAVAKLNGDPPNDVLAEKASKVTFAKTKLSEPVLSYAIEPKTLGLNVLRVMREAERMAARLQTERGPSTATIETLDGAQVV